MKPHRAQHRPWPRALGMRLASFHARAYTLVEVLVVITIMGIAGAIVVPSMLNSGTLTSQAAVRIVIADLLFAQNEAVARQTERKVIFDAELNRYRLADGGNVTLYVPWMSGSSGTGNYVIDFNQDTRFRGVRIDNVDFNGSSEITFDALGGVNTGGRLDIVSGNTRYRVTVAPFTGRVTATAVSGG